MGSQKDNLRDGPGRAPIPSRKTSGQGVVEYAGALVICVIVISVTVLNQDVYVDLLNNILTTVGDYIANLI